MFILPQGHPQLPSLWANPKSLLAPPGLCQTIQILICLGRQSTPEFMWIYYNLLPVFWLWLLWHSFPGVCLPPWLIPHIAEYSKLKGTWWAWSPRSFSLSSHCQPEMRMGLMLSGVYQCLQLPGSQLLPRTAKCHGSTWQEKANSIIHRLHQGLCGCTTMASSLEVKTEYKLGPQRKPWKDLRKIPTPSTSQPFQSSYLVNKGPTRPSWSILYRHGDSLLLSLLQGGISSWL